MLLEGLSASATAGCAAAETQTVPAEGSAFRRVVSRLLALSPLRG